MIRAIVIEDEQSCINRLSGLLAVHCKDSVYLAGTALTAADGFEAIRKLKPDLIFLDVQLHDKTGFDLLRRFDEVPCEIIFTTAFEKYAVQAFKFSAIDYLLKPVDPDDLRQAVGKLKEKMSKDDMAKKIDTLFHNLNTIEGASKKISVPTLEGLVFLQVSDIIRCQSDVNYTHVFLRGGRKITVAKTLKEFEDLLTEYDFYRVHNSHLINLSHIKRYNKGKGGFVSMIDDSEIEVSTRRKEGFLKRISENRV